MAGRSGIVRKSTAGYTYDFGIAIARTAVSELGLLSAKALTLTAAIYGLSSTINDMENGMRRNRIMFGGYVNTLKAMQFAQDKLLSGQTEFASADIVEGMRDIQKAGLDAKKTFDFVNRAAAATGTSFTQMGSMIEGAINGGNMSAFVDLGLMTQSQIKYFSRYTAGTNAMRNAVMRFLQSNKTLQTAMKGTMTTIQGQIRRMRGFSLEFARAIVGDPTDPNSFYSQLKRVITQVNDFMYRHLPTLKKVGFAIGQVLSFIIRTVGEFSGWVANKVMKHVNSMRLVMGNFQDNIMSMILWLELVKVRLVSLWNKYGDTIKSVIKWTLILYGTFKLLGALERGWLAAGAAAKAYLAWSANPGKWDFLRHRLVALELAWLRIRNATRLAGATLMNFARNFTLTNIITGLRMATGYMWGFNAAAAANPIGAIIVAVIALVAWIVYLVKNWDKVRKSTQGWGDSILFVTSLLLPVVGIPLLMAKHWEKFKHIFINLWITIRNVVVGIWYNIKNGITDVWRFLKDKFGPVMMPIINLFNKLWEGIKDAMQWLKDAFNDGWIGKILSKVGGMFQSAGDWSANFANSAAQGDAERHGGTAKVWSGGVNLVSEKEGMTKAEAAKSKGSVPETFAPVVNQGKKSKMDDSYGSPSTMTLQQGAVQIVVQGAKASPEEIAKEVRRVLREMQNSDNSRLGN